MKVDFPKIMNTDCAKLCLGYYKKLLNKEISEEEFEKEIVFTALESIEELKFKPILGIPALLYKHRAEKRTLEWRALDREDKRAQDKMVFDNEEVKKYYSKLENTTWDNRGKAEWLEHLMRVFMKLQDKINAAKVWAVYDTYPDEMEFVGVKIWHKKKF